MAMNKARRTANLNNILTYDTLGNSTLIANLTVEGLTGAGFVKADAAGLLSVDTAAYTVTTGATNYLPKITAPNTLGQSLVYDNGTSVLVNTAVGVPGYSHAFQVMANGAGGLVVSTTDVASAIGIVNSSSANKTWDISPYGNHLVINESGIATRMKFDAGGNITIGDITNTGHKLEVVGSFRTTGTNTLSALQGVGDRMVVANTNGVLTTQPIPTGSITGTGAAGQVNFWTGTTTVSGSNNLFWDNANSRLGIGTNAPAYLLQVLTNQNGQTAIAVTNTTIGTSASAAVKVFANNGQIDLVKYSTGRTPYKIIGAGDGAIYNYSVTANSDIAILNEDVGGRIKFGAGSASTSQMTLFANGNLAINSGVSDLGVRFGVVGDTLLRGSGNTNTTTALTVQNSDGANAFRVLNNGQINLGNSASFPLIRTVTEASVSTQAISGTKVLFVSQDTETGSGASFSFGSNTVLHTSGNLIFSQFSRDFIPTSGTGTVTTLRIGGTINQTGGANGITRGLYVNPTLTAAADFRAIETTAGNVLFGSNFFWDNANGRLGIGTNAPAQKLEINGNLLVNQGGNGFYTSQKNNHFTQNAYYDGSLWRSYGTSASFGSAILFQTNGQNSKALGIYVDNSISAANESLAFNALMEITTGGNLLLGTTTDGGQRLQVIGDTLLRGSGATSATTALTVQSSASTDLFTVRNDGFLFNRYAAQIGSGTNVANGANALTIVGYGSYAFNFNNSTGFTFPNVELTSSYLRLGGGGEKFIGNSSFTAGADLYLHAGWYSVTASYGKVSIGTAFNSSASRTLAVFDMQTMKANISGIIEAGSATSTNGSVILRGNYTSGYLTTLGTDASSGGPMLSYGIESAQNSTAGAFVSSSAITIPRSAYVQNGGHIWYTAPSSSTAIGTAVVPTKHMELYNSGNLVLGGGADDAVNRLQVGGNVRVVGNTTTTGTKRVGQMFFGTNGQGAYLFPHAGTAAVSDQNGINLTFYNYATTTTPEGSWAFAGELINATSGVHSGIRYQKGFSPTSGTATHTAMEFVHTINQTGGATGITRAIRIIPSIVTAADFRAIEWGNNTGWGLYGVGTAKNYLNGTTLIGTTTDDGINKLQVAGSIASAGIMRSDAARTAATNDVSIALLGSNITTYAAGFTMGAAGYGLNAVYAQHEQRFGGNATFDAGNLNGAGLMLNRLAPTATGTITMNQQAGRIRTMSNLHLQTQIQGNNNITVTHMSGLHIYGHYRTTGTITLTVGDYYGVLLADPNEFSTGPTITGTNWGFYQQGAAPINAFEGSMLVGTTTTDANNRLVVSGNTRVTGNMTSAQFRLSALNTAPATSTSAGTTGEIRIDADNIYVCTATNTWKRAAIATF